MAEKILMKGNEAIAEAAILAGCRYYFGYPITPQSEISEYLAWRMFEAGGVFLQAESEIAAISMVLGAGVCGARVMTSSSGPGLSLKQECISHLAGCRVPCLIVDVSRGGPGVGTIQGAQGDYFQATRGGGNGDYFTPVYAPNSVQEMIDYTLLGFAKSDEYRTPVLLLSDGNIGQMMEPVSLPEPVGKLPEKDWALAGFSGEGRRKAFKSLFLDPQACEEHNLSLQANYSRIERHEVRWEEIETGDADIVLVAFGLCSRICLTVMHETREMGIKTGLLRPITLWPFPYAPLKALAGKGRRFLVVEQNAGQMVQDVRLAAGDPSRVEFHGRLGGTLPQVDDIVSAVRAMAGVA
jgi:2-oxoglutarate ferredoxin oxidoreductase subunit alpha